MQSQGPSKREAKKLYPESRMEGYYCLLCTLLYWLHFCFLFCAISLCYFYNKENNEDSPALGKYIHAHLWLYSFLWSVKTSSITLMTKIVSAWFLRMYSGCPHADPYDPLHQLGFLLLVFRTYRKASFSRRYFLMILNHNICLRNSYCRCCLVLL